MGKVQLPGRNLEHVTLVARDGKNLAGANHPSYLAHACRSVDLLPGDFAIHPPDTYQGGPFGLSKSVYSHLRWMNP